MKKRLFSGIQPSGELHIGNYLGAIKNWLNYLDDFACIFCIVDYHAITVPYAPAEMQERVLHVAATYLACGLTPDRCTIFRQSDVPEHTELAWIFSCITPINYLERMIQFKEKSEQHEHVSTGLFAYPILQAADILLYKAEAVPVGEDQVQHLELSRDIARKFNHTFGEYFPEPQALLTPARRVLGLDGEKKMSKSLGNHIALAEDPVSIAAKLKRAKTDTRRQRRSDPGEPLDCNIYSYHTFFSSQAEQDYVIPGCRTAAISCLECKQIMIDNIVRELAPIRESYQQWISQPEKVQEILSAGAGKVRPLARETLAGAKKMMGLI